jgi:hypothetical protein
VRSKLLRLEKPRSALGPKSDHIAEVKQFYREDFRPGFSAFGSQDVGDFFFMVDDKITEAAEKFRSFGETGFLPRRLGFPRAVDGFDDFLFGRRSKLSDRFAGCGISHLDFTAVIGSIYRD